MRSRRRICFVATEFAPITKGGIGVVVKNLVTSFRPEDVEIHVVVLGLSDVSAALRDSLCGVRFHPLSFERSDFGDEDRLYPPRYAFTNTEWHWRSLQVCRYLLMLERQGASFDLIEFQDWGGLAFCSLQARLLGEGLLSAELSIRLHSTDALIRKFNPREARGDNACLADLERKCLRDADTIVAHLSPVAHATQQFFGFSEEWLRKIRVELPPVCVDHRAKSPSPINAKAPLVFGSKLQAFKRPDIFVRGVAAFLRQVESYEGSVYLIAHAFDDEYASAILNLVPADLKARFLFLPSLSNDERNQLISRSIFVVPSDFESFCLAAYEASLQGATVLLNARNPAFGAGTPWHDGINCLKFDGTALGLANRLVELLDETQDWSGLSVVEVPATPPHWYTAPMEGRPGQRSEPQLTDLPIVSVVVPHFNLGPLLLRTISSINASDYPQIEILVVDDSSTDEVSREVVRSLAAMDQPTRIRCIHAPANLGLAGARNLGVRNAAGKYILTLDADDLIAPDFLSRAVATLERHSDIGVVVTQAGYFHDDEQAANHKFVDYAVFIGEALSTGSFMNRFSTATAVFRSDLLREDPYDEALSLFEDWDLYSRLVLKGVRIAVTNDICFFYRRRKESMIHGPSSFRRVAENLDRIRAKQPPAPSVVVGDAQAYFLQLALAGSHMAPSISVAPRFQASLEGANNAARGPKIVELSAEELKSTPAGQFSLRLLGAINRRAPWLLVSLFSASAPLRGILRAARNAN